MKKITIFVFILIGSSVFSQNEEPLKEIYFSGGFNFGRTKKDIPLKIGENKISQPVFFENFQDRSIFTINYLKTVKSIHTLGIGFSYRNAQNYSYNEQLSNRFQDASFSMYGISFIYSRRVLEQGRFQLYATLSPVLNYTILNTNSKYYYIQSNQEETNVDLLYVEGLESIAVEKTLTPEIKSLLICKFGVSNNVSFFSSFGMDTFIVLSDVAPENLSLMFLLDFGISVSLR